MTLLYILLGSNPTSPQFHTWVALGWISFISEGMIIFCKIGWLLSSLSRESSSSSLNFLDSLCFDMFVSSIAACNLIIAWLVQYSSFACLTKLLFCVCLALNWWKVEISSDPFIYLLLAIRFYQRSVPFFLYGFQFNFYFKYLPIRNTVSRCSRTGGAWYVDYIHYSFKKIFVAHGD